MNLYKKLASMGCLDALLAKNLASNVQVTCLMQGFQ